MTTDDLAFERWLVDLLRDWLRTCNDCDPKKEWSKQMKTIGYYLHRQAADHKPDVVHIQCLSEEWGELYGFQKLKYSVEESVHPYEMAHIASLRGLHILIRDLEEAWK